MPKGKVRFAYGEFNNLPIDAEEVGIFMRPNDSTIYFVPIRTIPKTYERYVIKEEDVEKNCIEVEGNYIDLNNMFLN
jgi:hypothetical protein